MYIVLFSKERHKYFINVLIKFSISSLSTWLVQKVECMGFLTPLPRRAYAIIKCKCSSYLGSCISLLFQFFFQLFDAGLKRKCKLIGAKTPVLRITRAVTSQLQWLNGGPTWNRNKLGTAARSCSCQLLKLDNKICLLSPTNILANILRWLIITIRFERAQFAARCELPEMSKFAPSTS